MRARAFARHAPRGGERRASGTTPTLRSDEVSRFSVRIVTIARASDAVTLGRFARLPEMLRAGDLVVVNDAATLPASLRGRTARGDEIELRLAAPVEGSRLVGVLFGAGDHRTRTEHRPAPPAIAIGERLHFGRLDAQVTTIAGRLDAQVTSTSGRLDAQVTTIAGRFDAQVRSRFDAQVTSIAGRRIELVAQLAGDALWQALYAAGSPVQYAHRVDALPLYAVQTAYAARPWSAEMPSAGRPFTWDVLLGLRQAGVEIATLTHAAGLSSTGDDALDRALPWPERYEVPRRTVEQIAQTKARGGRVIAVGTTVVRALEAAAATGELVAGGGIATVRLDAAYRPRVVDGLISGLHVPGESHFELLSAFVPRERLERAIALAAAHGLSSHELGDACLIL